ncbi:hypothetical protein HH310_34550 [Actinoplanes sp. TBRC 11911]|uniref:hypothetical protein n=1 Tax=Actinoplanes sp. TBRC 11911 TaxID=2729386 RepID=UPI00145EF44E|nr:hypothetical protein [Actinoplanes sp. TBRC 11911]NMO56285.1 hypothetical protein [Actinoplanes sp. TBRC 11911]
MSVFRTTNTNSTPSRDQYPINRLTEIDEPTERIDPPRKRSRTPFVLVLLTLFALNVAGVAIFFAWRAGELARAALAKQPVAPGGPESFDVAYAREPLRVQVGCAAVMNLDLDEPRANSIEPVSDLRYDSRCGDQPPRLSLGPGATAGAQVPDSDLDAAGCARAIRTSPLGPGASVEVRKGAVLCVQTTTRMVLVEITEVGRTGTAGMRATSWKVAG